VAQSSMTNRQDAQSAVNQKVISGFNRFLFLAFLASWRLGC